MNKLSLLAHAIIMPIAFGILALTPKLTLAQMAAPKITADPKAVNVTVTLTGTPLTGLCPFNMNVSWTAVNAATCTKTGAWTGQVPASGSESIQVNNGPSTYTLTCSSSSDSRQLTWTQPTTNTDGTAATIIGNKVYHSNTATGVETAVPIVLTPAKTTYMLTGLPAGPRYVGVKATGTGPIDSLMSGIATVSITLPVGADTVQATCTPPPEPRPPTGVTIASTVWEIIRTGTTQKVGRDVGLIDLGVVCLGEKPVIIQNPAGTPFEYWGVPKDLVRIYRKPKSQMLLGHCQLQTTS